MHPSEGGGAVKKSLHRDGHIWTTCLNQEFFCKGQVVTILLMLSVATTQLCGFDLKAAIDNTQINGYDCVTMKPYLLKQGEGPQLAGLCFKGWVSFYQLEKQRNHRQGKKL